MHSSIDLRTWFAGCALANSRIVTSSDPTKATRQAFEIADKMMLALSTENTTDKANKATEPALRRSATITFPNKVPDPNVKSVVPSLGFYSITHDKDQHG